MDNFKQYRRKQIAELREVTQLDIDNFKSTDSILVSNESTFKVSISDADLSNGSPKIGDMIARNVNNHNDQWLVEKKYFEENFEELPNYNIIGNNQERRIFKIPIKSKKRWWEFWKKDESEMAIKKLLTSYSLEIKMDDIWIPEKDEKNN